MRWDADLPFLRLALVVSGPQVGAGVARSFPDRPGVCVVVSRARDVVGVATASESLRATALSLLTGGDSGHAALYLFTAHAELDRQLADALRVRFGVCPTRSGTRPSVRSRVLG